MDRVQHFRMRMLDNIYEQFNRCMCSVQLHITLWTAALLQQKQLSLHGIGRLVVLVIYRGVDVSLTAQEVDGISAIKQYPAIILKGCF